MILLALALQEDMHMFAQAKSLNSFSRCLLAAGFAIAVLCGMAPKSSIDTVTISTSSYHSWSGTTTGDGVYAVGDDVTVVATPSSGYAFLDWTENGSVVSTSISFSFTAANDTHLVAEFGRTAVSKVWMPPFPFALHRVPGYVTIAVNAPRGGLTVDLSSDSPDVTIPTTVFIPEGTRIGVFEGTTADVPVPSDVNVTASFGGSTRSVAVEVIPLGVKSLTPDQPFIFAGGTLNVTVQLWRPATNDVTVKLSVRNPDFGTVPATVVVKAGSSTATFDFVSNVEANGKLARIGAAYIGRTCFTNIQVGQPPRH